MPAPEFVSVGSVGPCSFYPKLFLFQKGAHDVFNHEFPHRV